MIRLATPVTTALRYLALLIAAGIVLLPFLWTVVSSFVRLDIDLDRYLLPLDSYWLGHYRDIATQTHAVRWLVNSTVVTLVILTGNIIFNTMAGYALARIRFRGSGIALGVVVATMMLPPQILFEPIYTVIIRFGWLNSYHALIVPFLVNPFGVFLMRQFFRGFPQELDDAGRLGGLGAFGVFRRLAIPVAAPAIAAQAIFIFVWNWNSFIFPSVLASRPEMFTLPVGIYQITHTAFTNHIAQSMAGVVLTSLPALLMFSILQRRFIETLAGVVKG